jgi:hypothetical protein
MISPTAFKMFSGCNFDSIYSHLVRSVLTSESIHEFSSGGEKLAFTDFFCIYDNKPTQMTTLLKKPEIKREVKEKISKIRYAIQESTLIKSILIQRQQAVKVIQKFLLFQMEKKKETIINLAKKVITDRTEKAILLQKHVRRYFTCKDVKKVIKMKNENYCIFYYKSPNDENGYNLLTVDSAKLLVKHEKHDKMFNFTYNRYLNCFLLFIKKIGTYKAKYLINFVLNGNVVVDTNFPTEMQSDGKYYNVLNFQILRLNGYLSNIKPCCCLSLNKSIKVEAGKKLQPKRKNTYPTLESTLYYITKNDYFNPILLKSLKNEFFSPSKRVSFNLLINYY